MLLPQSAQFSYFFLHHMAGLLEKKKTSHIYVKFDVIIKWKSMTTHGWIMLTGLLIVNSTSIYVENATWKKNAKNVWEEGSKLKKDLKGGFLNLISLIAI